MCDFSQYGGPSAEWLALEAELSTPSVDGLSINDLKKLTNGGREATSAKEMESLAGSIEMQDYTIEARDGYKLQARTYRKKQTKNDRHAGAVYIHLHGGGHLFGTLDSEDAACARLAISSGVTVLNVNYRHTPEATYPVPWNDVEDAYSWLHAVRPFHFDPSFVILGGISAGAWMTASIALAQHLGNKLQDCPKIAGQVLIIPCLIHADCYGPQMAKMLEPEVSSRHQHANAPILPNERIKLFLDLLKVQDIEAEDLLLNPGNVTPTDAKGLPPTVIGVAGYDPLRDDGLLYAQTLEAAR